MQGRRRKKILPISCKQQDMVDCRLCVAIVKKNCTGSTDINVLWNSFILTLAYFVANSKQQLHVQTFHL